MTTPAFLSLTSTAGVLLILALALLPAPLLGRWIHRIYEHHRADLVEQRLAHWLDWSEQQNWRSYLLYLLVFNLLCFVLLFTLLLAQGHLPFNPQHLPGLSADLAFNTAVSFVSNTNWQAYSGEDSLSYLSQMLGLGVQNFVSAATGMAVAIALFRGIARRSSHSVGHFGRDLYRGVVYLLLPLSLLLALVLIWQGVPQNFNAYLSATTLDGGQQWIPGGPAASQIAIKQLGTNGGGFFGVNSAHPFENPTLLSNLLQCAAILLIPAGFVFAFGHYVRDRRQAVALFITMSALLLLGLGVLLWSEGRLNPLLASLQLSDSLNWEGKESRFGIDLSALWTAMTSAASNGSVNAMHDSLSAWGGLVPLVNILLGEVIFGGVGAGMYGMLLFVLLAVFLSGLMIGRTPAYLGKKIEAREIQWALVALLTMPLGILVLGSLTALLGDPQAVTSNPGPHGLSQWLYAYASATGNNGSAFAGFAAGQPLQNVLLGLAMLIGRYGVIIPVLAIAGSLASKAPRAASAAELPTHGPLFIALLTLSLCLLGALNFFPVLMMGPVAEALSLP
ncbi:potassium-transporting ATPase subunit KdpA [Pokkaliibacter plantistimulans]|uniref:Potassium-transporting ATPase potassium-binding subunit n=1 Tax=Proteobacteria bacterium 228 TaxID=2083153 RepID=A0A2S5KWM8_9PROT|nr:potassium-transporting ATPase subunit KdpA [Pokkaliibacter plantistimulans]PPC79261.1 potassium-transporting ATPase subunit KdpA [Pokkaliibacter plantistimulans]